MAVRAKRRAVVLLSGGMDSAVTLALARQRGFAAYCLTVDYGQRHQHELKAARCVAKELGAEQHLVLALDLRPIGGSVLTSTRNMPEVSEQPLRVKKRKLSVPPTYVPARNTILLSLALAWAEVLGIRDIFIGANVVDYSGYPDCRPAFLRCFERLSYLATKRGMEEGMRFRIRAPLLHMSKAQIIRTGTKLGVDFRLTHTCYTPSPRGLACGLCDSCRLRLAGFAKAGIRDPARYMRL